MAEPDEKGRREAAIEEAFERYDRRWLKTMKCLWALQTFVAIVGVSVIALAPWTCWSTLGVVAQSFNMGVMVWSVRRNWPLIKKAGLTAKESI